MKSSRGGGRGEEQFAGKISREPPAASWSEHRGDLTEEGCLISRGSSRVSKTGEQEGTTGTDGLNWRGQKTSDSNRGKERVESKEPPLKEGWRVFLAGKTKGMQ